MRKIKSKKCNRVILSDKYERTDPAIEIWWKNLFAKLESERSVVSFRLISS